jgi:hypothetical protein
MDMNNMRQNLSVQGLQQSNPMQFNPILKSGGEGNWLTGYNSGVTRIPLGTPGQMAATEQMLQQGLQNVNRNPSFDPYAANARQQMEQQSLPSLFERINAMGGSQGPAASMLGGQAMSNLEGQLALGRSQFDQNQQQFGMQQLGMGMTPMYHNDITPESNGALMPILSILGTLIGGATTGGVGAGIGGAAGSAIAQLLKTYFSGSGEQNPASQGLNNNAFGFGKENSYLPKTPNYYFGQQNNGGFKL